MFKIIVPNLVTLETDLDHLGGFYLSKELGYFGSAQGGHEMNYKACVDNKIQVPDSYDFRNSNFQVTKDIWTYRLNKMGLNFTFQYDYIHKKFTFNQLLSKLPVRINWTHPAGDYLADIINLDLFLRGIVVLNGMAFEHGGKINVLCAPSLNGKTTFLKKNRARFDGIISDDYVLLDLNKKQIIATPLEKKKRNGLSRTEYPVDRVSCIINRTGKDAQDVEWGVSDFVKMNAMKFLDNVLIKNLIFYYDLGDKINSTLSRAESPGLFDKAVIRNYDYEQLIRS